MAVLTAYFKMDFILPSYIEWWNQALKPRDGFEVSHIVELCDGRQSTLIPDGFRPMPADQSLKSVYLLRFQERPLHKEVIFVRDLEVARRVGMYHEPNPVVIFEMPLQTWLEPSDESYPTLNGGFIGRDDLVCEVWLHGHRYLDHGMITQDHLNWEAQNLP